MNKCQACQSQYTEATWAWQPFGPDEKIEEAFTLLGSHYRGFPIIKVCSDCKSDIQSGDGPINFEHEGKPFMYYDGKIKEIPAYVSDSLLWFVETWDD